MNIFQFRSALRIHLVLSGLFKLLIFTLLFVNFSVVTAQNYSTKDKKAIRFYESAIEALQTYKHQEALDYLQESIDKDPQFIEPYIVMGDAYIELGNIKGMIDSYRKALAINPDYYITGNLTLAKALYETGQYVDAYPYIERYLAYKNHKPANLKAARDLQERIEFSIQAINNPVDFLPGALSEHINSEYSEYWPSLSADQSQFIYTRLLPIDPDQPLSPGNAQEDFYISFAENGEWTQAEPIGKPINTLNNEGAQSVSADGRFMVFTACNRQDGYGNCDLYFTHREGNQWQTPENAGMIINTAYRETQPSLSADGRVLYFTSNRPGGYGGTDIYFSRFEDGSWSAPENMGGKINTNGNEVSPFIHFDNQTLYFSSDGHVGLGNKDIFMVRKDSAGGWGNPRNIGFPVNDSGDQIGLIIDAKGRNAYYASTRPGFRDQDIYTFEIPEIMKPIPVSYVKGNVYDKKTRYPLSAKIELINLETGNTTNEVISDRATGNFLICLPIGNMYAFNASAIGYLFYSDNFSVMTDQTIDKPQEIDIPLVPVEVGKSVILKNIFFETDSHVLKSESRIELSKIYDFLTFNASVRIEISGHTDDVGTEAYNLDLSEKRANSVRNYLIDLGIDDSRIISKGYGEQKPIASNETTEGRALNRRTEFKIISK